MSRITRVGGRSPKRLLQALTLAMGVAFTSCGRSGDSSSQSVTAAEQDLVLDVEVTGSLKALQSEQVGPPSSVTDLWQFKLIRLIPEGTEVKPGTEVVAFDESELEKLLTDRQSEAQSLTEELGKLRAEHTLTGLDDRLALQEAQSKQRKAELKADLPPDLTAQLALQTAGVDLKLAQREVEYHKQREQTKRQQERSEQAILKGRLQRSVAAVTDIKAELAAMSVKARRGGTVVYTVNSQGEKKKVGDRASRFDTVLQITALSNLFAQGQVDEVDASSISSGQHVGLRLEAHPDKEYPGVVERVAPLVQTESAESRVKVVLLDIKLLATDPLLMRPGMRFRGRIEVARVRGVLQVPLTAIASTAGGPVVTKLGRRGALPPSPVKLGRRSREMVEITQGLKRGEQVLLQTGSGTAASKSGTGSGGLGSS